jgi:sulfur-oxidizing protein SoxY
VCRRGIYWAPDGEYILSVGPGNLDGAGGTVREDRDLSRRSFCSLAGSGALALAALAVGVDRAEGASRALPHLVEDDDPPEQVKRVLEARFGKRPIRKGHVQLDIPEVAPDGRSVPVFIETDLPVTSDEYVKGVHIVVDHNPDIHLAAFELTPTLGSASIDTRIKMRRTSYVRAIAETSRGELWYAATKVFVTLNGCG